MGKTFKPVAQPASAAQYEKIPGTQVKMLKGGIPVRVVHATGREFHINDVSGAWKQVEKAGGQQKGNGKGNGKKGQQVKLQAVQPKGKSKGGSKGQVQFKTPPAIKNSTKGTGKGAKGGKKSQVKFNAAATVVKKKVLKNGKGGGKGSKRQKPRKELTPEEEEARQEKQAERHTEKIEKEMRMLVNDTYFTGEVVTRGRFNAWVKPQSPPIPASVLPELRKMNEEFRAKSANNSEGKNKPFCGGAEENVIYVAMADIQEDGLKLTEGLAVRFKLYTDSKGVGGCEVVSA